MKICLICSTGGHLLSLYHLREFWERYPRFWVTFEGKDAEDILQGEKVYRAYSPTNRNIWNFFRNLFLAVKILTKERPEIIFSTGAGICVPFFYIARLFRMKTVYIELFTRVNSLSLSAKLIYPFANHLLVQWPDLAKKYRKTKYEGQII